MKRRSAPFADCSNIITKYSRRLSRLDGKHWQRRLKSIILIFLSIQWSITLPTDAYKHYIVALHYYITSFRHNNNSNYMF